MELRGSQNEHQMLRRLLQNFQQCVEGRGRQHVDLVHNVDPLFHIGGRVDGLVPQSPHLVHAVIRCRVQFQHVQKAAALNADTGRALATGIAVHRMLAVDRLGQNFGAGGLAGAPGAGEKIGMGGPALGHLLLQGLRNMRLPDDVRKHLGPPLSIQGLIHGKSLPGQSKSPACSCGAGTLAAHGRSRLMLLGSPPDMVRRVPLRETGSAAARGGLVYSLFILLYSFQISNQKFLFF